MDDTHTTPRSDLAGEVITFKSGRCGSTNVGRVREALAEAGLDPTEAKDLLPANAFRRALRQMSKDRTIDQLVDTDDGQIRFQLTEKTTNDLGLVEYDRDAVLTADDQMRVECLEDPDLALTAETLIATVINERTATDVKQLVKRMFVKSTSRELFCINSENGGTYFVPESHRSFTSKVDDFLKLLGGELGRFPVPRGTEEGNASIGSAISEGIEQYVQQLDSAVEDWDVGTMGGTQARAAGHYQEAVFKAEAMREFLGDKVEQLQARVEKSRDAMARKIMQLTAEKEQESTSAADLILADNAVDSATTIY